MSRVEVEVTRGGRVESVHRVHVVAVDSDGRRAAAAGDPARVVFARSAIKPIQALPLVEDGAADSLGLTDEELALCCASHSGEPLHVATARSILKKAGASEKELACGPHAPFYAPAARELVAARKPPRRVHNNCSGKHAGMLALARFHGWPAEGYQQADHPVQRRALAELSRWSGVPEAEIGRGVDGCGVVTFALPLEALARAFARFGAAAHAGEAPGAGGVERAAARVLRAMGRHPHMVGGTDRLCTELMRATEGRVVAKVGAEGVYCAVAPAVGIGIALKVEDGATRAAETALLGVLDALGLLSDAARAHLERWMAPVIENTRGEQVGEIRAVVELAERA